MIIIIIMKDFVLLSVILPPLMFILWYTLY